MSESIRILATTFDSTNISLELGTFKVKLKGFLGKTLTYPPDTIKSVETANEDNTKKVSGTLMGAAVGGALTGGVGAVVGALAGGNSKSVIFIAEFHDGNQLMAECSYGAYMALTAKVKQVEFDKIKQTLNPPNQAKGKLGKIKENVYGLLSIIILIFLVKSCFGSKKSDTETQAVQQSAPVAKVESVDPKTKIDEHAVEVMTKDFYPKAFKKYGSEYMKKVNTLAPSIALKAVEDPTCDYLEVLTFSATKSTKTEAYWLADCRNKTRIYLSEKM